MAPTNNVIAKVAYSYESVRYEVGQPLFIPEGAYLEAAIKAGHVERYTAAEVSTEAVDEVSDGLEGEALLESLGELWDSDETPEAYLEKFADGPLAELAKRIVEVKASLSK